MRPTPISSLTLIALLLIASPAEAHLMSTGLGPIYDGISHFALSPEDLVPSVALALLAGQCGPGTGRRVIFVLPVAWLLGGVAGLSAPGVKSFPDIGWISFMLLGGLVAANVKLSSTAITVLAVLLGSFHGFIDGATMGSAVDGIRVLIGIAATVFTLCTLVAAAIVALPWAVARIGVRVLGSWTAATGMLLLGWSLR
jgi:hydrogenase/urease accessory protein HupE